MSRNIQKKMELVLDGAVYDLGSLQHRILTAIVEKDYDKALKTLQDYRKVKSNHYTYIAKTSNIFDHSENLIQSIKIKKTFPNLESLPQKKLEELAEKTKENWEELRIVLRRLNAIEKEMQMEDARSTVLVVRALMVATFLIVSAFVVNEAILSFGISLKSLMHDFGDVLKSLF